MIVDERFEDKVLGALIRSREFCQVAAAHIKPTYFDSTTKHNLAKMAIDFWTKYDATLTASGFGHYFKEMIRKKVVKVDDGPAYAEEFKRLKAVDLTDWRFVLEQLILFIKKHEVRKLMEDSVNKHLPREEFMTIEQEMARISAIRTTSSVEAYDYWSEKSLDDRLHARETSVDDLAKGRAVAISTGIKQMDDVMRLGGWARRELNIIMAPPKRGKTMALLYFANAAAWQGFNVALFTLEVSREVISERLDAHNTKTMIRAVHDRRAYINKIMKEKRAKGDLFIFEYPTKSCSPGDVEAQVRRLEMERGIKINFIVVDYGSIMKPTRYYNDKLTEQATIYEDLRAIASKFDVPVLTATQTNRSGVGKTIAKGTDVSGTFEQIMVADQIISLSAGEDDVKRREMRIHFAESRNNPSKTLLIKTGYSFGTFYDGFVAEEE